MTLIIAYKFSKALLMLLFAVWLTVTPNAAHRSLNDLAQELAEGGATFVRGGLWIEAHLSRSMLVGGAVLAWVDSLSSALEGLLLLSGRSWAEWVVVIELALLIPIEIYSLEHRPGLGKLLVLAGNALIVIYLVRERVSKARA